VHSNFFLSEELATPTKLSDNVKRLSRQHPVCSRTTQQLQLLISKTRKSPATRCDVEILMKCDVGVVVREHNIYCVPCKDYTTSGCGNDFLSVRQAPPLPSFSLTHVPLSFHSLIFLPFPSPSLRSRPNIPILLVLFPFPLLYPLLSIFLRSKPLKSS